MNSRFYLVILHYRLRTNALIVLRNVGHDVFSYMLSLLQALETVLIHGTERHIHSPDP